jgi:GNAT superfamily N-acetyltransferase
VSLTVRPLETGDRAAWDDLWRAYLAFYKTDLPAAQYDLHFARLTDPAQPDLRGYVAVEDGVLAGLAHVIWHPHGWHAAPVCYLQDLYTSPPFRRHGVAEALVRAVYDAADAGGAADVYWLTQSFNDTARRLYDRIGRVTPFIKYQRG